MSRGRTFLYASACTSPGVVASWPVASWVVACLSESPCERCESSRGTKRPLPVNRNSRVRFKWLSKVLKLRRIKRSVWPSAERKYRFLYSGLFRRLCFAFNTVILSPTSLSSSRISPGPLPRAARLVTATGSMPGSAKPSARTWLILSFRAASVSLALTSARFAMTTVTSGEKGSRVWGFQLPHTSPWVPGF